MIHAGLHVSFVPKEVGDRSVPAQRQVDPVKIAGSHARKGKCRFTQRFTRNGTRIGARASQFVMSIHHRDGLPESGRGCSAHDSGGATADDDEIEFLNVFGHRHLTLQ